MDLNSLLGGTSDSSTSLLDPTKLLAPLMPFMIALTIISTIITILWLVSIIDKWRQGRAILETRDILREMNERDKARSLSSSDAADQRNAGTASTDSADTTSVSTS